MKKIKSFYKKAAIIPSLFMALTVTYMGCDPQEVELNENDYELAEAMLYDGRIDSTLIAFVHGSRTQMLNLEGYYTILAPSNQAWGEFIRNDMRFDTLGDFQGETDWARRIIDFYIIEGVYDWDELEGKELMTESGEIITISSNVVNGARNGTANILPDRQIEAFNGFIYEIDKVITGIDYPFLSVYEALSLDSMQTSIFKAMVDRVPEVKGLLDRSTPSDLLYFALAPKDSAMNAYFDFKGYGQGLDALNNMPADTLTIFVKEHVFADEEDIAGGDIDRNFETIAGYRVDYDDDWLQDFRTDYDATNGRVTVYKTADDDGGSLIELELPLPDEGG